MELENCTQKGLNCSWISSSNSGWTEDGNFSVKLNETHSYLCPNPNTEVWEDDDDGNGLFRFIVLGIGISVVATLGMSNIYHFNDLRLVCMSKRI
jgi:hypothetical protein